MAEKDKEEGSKEEVGGSATIPIDWHIPEGVMTPFASNMLVQTIENEYKISFFELKPAIRLDKSDPIPTSVRADCVASVIITADRLAKFVEVLKAQLDKQKKNPK